LSEGERAANGTHRPDVFIVGSMKCGTTILFDFLTAHEDVVQADEKECHFFSLYYERGVDWYLGKFPRVEGKKRLIDASPTYFDMCLDCPTVERIKEFSPEAKIIILVRHPVVRTMSHFNHLKKINRLALLETLSLDDMVERNWPSDSSYVQLESIRSMLLGFSLYERKIAKFVEAFGKENVMVVNNDDLRKYGDVVVPQVFEFIGLTPPQGVDFTEQKYLHGTEKITLKPRNYFALLEDFGLDYYRTCRMGDFTRPKPEASHCKLNQPVGTLVNEVGVGEDGWLFLATGSNNVLEMYGEEDGFGREMCRAWNRRISERVVRLSELGARYYHVLVPEKMSLLGAKLHWPIDCSRGWGAMFNQMADDSVQEHVIDLIGYMRTAKNPEQYFHKTDSHWNFYGAFLAHQLICSTLGFEVDKELIKRNRASSPILLDLGGKLPDHPMEDAFFVAVRENARVVNDDGLVRFKRENGRLNDGGLHVGSFIQFHNPRALNKERVIIFGDSFSEYRDHSLTALMAETFEHVAFIWSTGIDYGFCREFAPTIVFSIMIERFLRREADDDFDYRAYTKKRLETLLE
jgi:alginate O-acetyltransferase complex protein AlgJ